MKAELEVDLEGTRNKAIRKKLAKRYPTFAEFDEAFTVEDEVIEKMLADAEKNKVKPKDEEERQKTIPQLKRMLKALAARDLWDMTEYFQIIYRDNEMVKKAVELLEGKEG